MTNRAYDRENAWKEFWTDHLKAGRVHSLEVERLMRMAFEAGWKAAFEEAEIQDNNRAWKP